ncbi:hypothetical protein F4813DRAFT_357327 [Daldinia decipiens]|uniref:uncharacterized protein n=1 Tax=Daldinia decipiens TaxID=326647 RepID=UPI0020C409B7|nr:uncharacterized protein F4813DRAFT_357327 [Daldinia decipiens]KAI1658095.1 hypothetical protein F4813DRAFT_357327 [Daldinia decipiens]
MSESFASNQKMDSDIPLDDDDPSPSPESKLFQNSSPTMSMSAASPARSDGDRIECLVRRMSKQTLVRESLLASAMESQGCLANSSLPINPEPMQIEIQTLPHISEPLNELGYSYVTETPSDQYISQSRPSQHYESMENLPGDPIMDGNFTSSIGTQDKQEQPEMSLQSRFPNLRRLDLMANMIENEEQCNVHIPRPVTLIPTPRLPSSADLAPSAGPASRRGLPLPYDNNAVLEVDEGICTQPDEQASSEILGLRDASGPESIRKLGHLKYRTSLETAMRCKNMRKSAPRMRRRPKTQPKETQQTDSTINPASTTPTTPTTPTNSMAA